MDSSFRTHLGAVMALIFAPLAVEKCCAQIVPLNTFEHSASELAYDSNLQHLYAYTRNSFPDLAILEPTTGELKTKIPPGNFISGLDVVTGPLPSAYDVLDVPIGALIGINQLGDAIFFSPADGERIGVVERRDLNADARSVMYSDAYTDFFTQLNFAIYPGNGIDWENGRGFDAVAVNDFSSNTFPGQFGEMKEFRGHFFFASPFGLYETTSNFNHLRTISLETLGISQQPNALAFDDVTGEAWLAVGDKIHHYGGFEIVPEPSGNLLLVIAIICLLAGKLHLRVGR
jgi:hypothetical protein